MLLIVFLFYDAHFDKSESMYLKMNEIKVKSEFVTCKEMFFQLNHICGLWVYYLLSIDEVSYYDAFAVYLCSKCKMSQ